MSEEGTREERDVLRLRVGIVGGQQVGKRTLVEKYICEYFNGRKTEGGTYEATIVTNMGPVALTMTVIRDSSREALSIKNDVYIIVSDVSDKNMHKLYSKWHTDLTYLFGHRTFIVNCFNKTDITVVPTYVFESSAPAFDVSAKTTSGINEMLTHILRTVFDKERLIICM
jgi:GTPase SAR1 family protein